jgi:hypothetical protein
MLPGGGPRCGLFAIAKLEFGHFQRRRGTVGRLWAVDQAGATVDVLLTANRDRKAALRFLRKAIKWKGTPEKITVDNSGANTAALESHNAEHQATIEIRQVKYFNNIVEQEHRAIRSRRGGREICPFLPGKQGAAAAHGHRPRDAKTCATVHQGERSRNECDGWVRHLMPVARRVRPWAVSLDSALSSPRGGQARGFSGVHRYGSVSPCLLFASPGTLSW